MPGAKEKQSMTVRLISLMRKTGGSDRINISGQYANQFPAVCITDRDSAMHFVTHVV